MILTVIVYVYVYKINNVLHVTSDGNADKEINQRVQKAKRIHRQMSNVIVRKKEITEEVK